MSSSDKNESLFCPQSNALKSILNKPKEEKKSFGKQEFLARRKFFLEKLENDGGIPKPKSLINNSSTKKKTSSEKIKTAVNATKSINPSVTKTPTKTPVTINNSKSTKSSTSNIEKLSVSSSHEWSLASARSESLKKIIESAELRDTNTVGKSVFNARQKFFADSQLSSVEQLMPRPCTPPGFVYFERCPSPSVEPRRNSYSLYSSSPVLSPSIPPASPVPSTSIYSSSPTPSKSGCSLPWEHADHKKKEVAQPKPQSAKTIDSLKKLPLESKETIVLPEPVVFTKEALTIDEPITVKTEKVEAVEPMVAKMIKILPKPVQASVMPLPLDEPMMVTIVKAEKIEPQLPKEITIPEELPESVSFEKIQLPNDEPIELTTETVPMPEKHIPKAIYILPEPIEATKEELPQDQPIDIITETVVAGEQQIPKIINILPKPEEATKEELPNDESLEVITETVTAEKEQIPKIINIAKQENDESDSSISDNENKPLLSDEIVEPNQEPEEADETEPLINLNSEITENISKKTNSIGSISELLINNGTLSLDEPLPRKSIPATPTEGNLIDLSGSDMSDKVKNWYNVVGEAINKEEELNEQSLI